MMFCWKICPVLATGCTLVLKSAENTPLSALRFGEILLEAGMPAGVINIISGYGHDCGQHMVEHPDLDKIAFTGSTKVGKIINKAATDTLKRVSLELGGKSPHIIMDDCDMEIAIKNTIVGCMMNCGQICCAGSRVFVQEGIYDQFVEKLKAASPGYTATTPFDDKCFMGPLISQVQLDTVLRFIEAGKKEGATLVTGGNRMDRPGYFVEPTVFADVTDEMTIAKEEIFGPVIAVLKFKTIDEVIKRANNHVFGLASGVETTNINTAMKMAEKLRQGCVQVNCFNNIQPTIPFGGFRQSGHGRELGEKSLDSYQEISSVIIQQH
jgi:aldehyde dehydrogenase (NAD+)